LLLRLFFRNLDFFQKFFNKANIFNVGEAILVEADTDLGEELRMSRFYCRDA
jgi:hypothetical protein